MLATIQIVIHLAVFLTIVGYKQRCDKRRYRASAGILAFVIAGFNLASIGYLILIQPSYAVLSDYVDIVLSMVLLCVVVWFGGSTSRMIDSFKSLFH